MNLRGQEFESLRARHFFPMDFIGVLADHQIPRGAGSNATPVSLDNTLDCATTGAALASIRSLVGLPANALRAARTRSKKLVSRADSQIRLWRAIYARKRSGATFVAVTGSSGKTTTTALIAHVLSGVAPVRSQVGTNVYRAHVRSLQYPPRNDCYFVSETGSDGPGTLTPILNVLRPTVGVVTLVALEHKSTFRSIDAVVEEKGKLVEVLPANGLAVLNCDDPRVAAMNSRLDCAYSVRGGVGPIAGGDQCLSCPRPVVTAFPGRCIFCQRDRFFRPWNPSACAQCAQTYGRRGHTGRT